MSDSWFEIDKYIAYSLLLENVDPEVLCAYLVLLKSYNTQRGGSYARIDALTKILSIGKNRANKLIETLHEIKCTKLGNVNICYNRIENNIIKYTVFQKWNGDHESIKFSTDFVGVKADNQNKIAQIFKHNCIDILIRTLVSAHALIDNKIGCVYKTVLRCDYSEIDCTDNGEYVCKIFKRNNYRFENNDLVRLMIGGCGNYDNDSDLNSSEYKCISWAIDWLIENKFLSRKVIAIDSETGEYLYSIDSKDTKHTGSCRDIEPFARSLGLKRAARGVYPYRFYDTYPVLAPTSRNPCVIEVYKPTFYPTSQKIEQNRLLNFNETCSQNTFKLWLMEAQKGKDRFMR